MEWPLWPLAREEDISVPYLELPCYVKCYPLIVTDKEPNPELPGNSTTRYSSSAWIVHNGFKLAPC